MSTTEILTELKEEAYQQNFEDIVDLESAVLEFLKYKFAENKSWTTVKTYYTDLVGFLNDTDKDLNEIDNNEIKRHLNDYARMNQFQDTDRETDEKVSDASVQKRYRTLKVFTNWLLKLEVIDKNWMFKVQKPQVKSKKPSAWPYDCVVNFLNSFNDSTLTGHRNKVICITLADTGIRVGELVTLKKENIDFHLQTIIIKGKTGQRVCSFSEKLKKELQNWLKRKEKELPQTNLVFPSTRMNKDGFLMSTTSIAHTVTKHAKAAGVPLSYKLGPHSLRHTVGVHLARNNVNIRLVQQQFGHSNINTTQVYEEMNLNDLTDTLNEHSLLNEVEQRSKQNNIKSKLKDKLKKK